jgi:putative transposase
MCDLGHVSRAGLYRFDPNAERPDEDLELRDDIQRIALEFPYYGRPRITAELKRRGWEVNHKRVGRIMREDNLLCLRHRKFVVTTDSHHHLRIYPKLNQSTPRFGHSLHFGGLYIGATTSVSVRKSVWSDLAQDMELTGIDQLWRADITYIRLETEFVYLAVVLDAYSRRVIGWALDRHLEDDLAISALKMALFRRVPSEGLTHHSDRGVQYASNDYTGLLRERGIRISMSRSGNPYDNAACESFIKTLKYEEVYRQEYRDLAEARASIEQFIEKVYNGKRLHSALGYRPPVEFERSLPVASLPSTSQPVTA